MFSGKIYQLVLVLSIVLGLMACSEEEAAKPDAEPSQAVDQIVTEVATELATEIATEAATTVPTETVNDEPTQGATERATEAATAAATEVVSTESTQVATEAVAVMTIDQELYDRGVSIYRAQYCGTCHALEAANTRGIFGPAHDAIALYAAEYIASENYSGEADTIEAYIRESIVNPQAFFVPNYAASNHAMPAYTHLSDADVDAMVYMLAQQRNSENVENEP